MENVTPAIVYKQNLNEIIADEQVIVAGDSDDASYMLRKVQDEAENGA